MATHKLAVRLSELGLWTRWLGEEKAQSVLPHLSDPAAWDRFLSGTLSQQSRPELELCLQVRGLLYGEMAVALFAQNATGISLRPDSVYHTLDHHVTDWHRLQSQGSVELAHIQRKYGLHSAEEAQPPNKPSTDGEDANGERQKPRSKASREIMSLMPDVKPGKKDLVEDRQNELNDALEEVLTELKNMGEASKPFQCRVKKSEAWDYYDIIQRPMDLGTMTKKLRAYKYPSKASFKEDIDLIASNCHEYNEKDSLYVQYVDELQARAYALLESVPDVDVLALSSASGLDGVNKPTASPLRASEPSSPDSNSEDEMFGKGFKGLGRPQPGKRMRGKAGAIGKRLLQESAPEEIVRGDAQETKEAESAVVLPSVDAKMEPEQPSSETLGQLPAAVEPSPHPTAGDQLMTEVTPTQIAPPRVVESGQENGQSQTDVEPKLESSTVLPSQGPEASSAAIAPKADEPETAEEAPAERSSELDVDDVAERWPYDDWLQATLMQRMERLAERAAARHVPFSEQPALMRSPEGMAHYLEDRRPEGFRGLDTEPVFMPELEAPGNCVPELFFAGGPCIPRVESVVERPAKRAKQGTDSTLGEEGARVMLRQAVAKLSAREGFEGVKREALETLADLLGTHIRRLGRTLRLLGQRYGTHSQERLLSMCLNSFGVRNVAELAAYVKPQDAVPDTGHVPYKQAGPMGSYPAKLDPTLPILPLRPPYSTPQFPSVPIFKGVLPKVDTDRERSSSPSLEPDKRKPKVRAKKPNPGTSSASSRFPGLKSPTLSSPTAQNGTFGIASPGMHHLASPTARLP